VVESTPPAFVVWFTGISGAGKSTIASGVEQRLRALGLPIHNLDGDALRTGLNSDLDLAKRTGRRTFGESVKSPDSSISPVSASSSPPSLRFARVVIRSEP